MHGCTKRLLVVCVRAAYAARTHTTNNLLVHLDARGEFDDIMMNKQLSGEKDHDPPISRH